MTKRTHCLSGDLTYLEAIDEVFARERSPRLVLELTRIERAVFRLRRDGSARWEITASTLKKG